MEATAQWPQGIGVVKPAAVEKKPRPQKEQALNCPRCSSTNTKFCYYNNYSLSQPRYFCKTCRRYWTEGGSLRNVPVGGGSRKNKRPSSSSSNNSSSNISSKKLPQDPIFSAQNPKIQQGQDLNLAYNPSSHYNGISQFVTLPFGLDSKNMIINSDQNPNFSSISSRGVMGSFMSSIPVSSDANNSVYNNISNLHDHNFKPSLGFSLDGLENGSYGINLRAGVDQDNHQSSRMLFPFEELKSTVSRNVQFDLQQDNRGQGDQSNGYWSGMLAGGSW